MTLVEDKKIIAIIGSTGAQGGSLARAILNDPASPFTVRALTRNPTKAAAIALEKSGAKVVQFDMDGKAEEMTKALEGVYGLFVVTNYWEHFDHKREAEQAKAVVKAGEAAGVEHFIWSTLDNTVPFFDADKENAPPKVNGTYVPHFDSKARANAYFPADKTTFLYTGYYLENLYNFGAVAQGVFQCNMGNNKLPVIAVDDIGKCTQAIFKAGNKYKAKHVYLASEMVTPAELMRVASDVTGQPFSYKAFDREAVANFGVPGSAEIANMYEYLRLSSTYSDALGPSGAKSLNPDLQSVRSFFESHKKEILSIGPKQ